VASRCLADVLPSSVGEAFQDAREGFDATLLSGVSGQEGGTQGGTQEGGQGSQEREGPEGAQGAGLRGGA